MNQGNLTQGASSSNFSVLWILGKIKWAIRIPNDKIKTYWEERQWPSLFSSHSLKPYGLSFNVHVDYYDAITFF